MIREPRRDFADWTDLCRALAATLVAVSHIRHVLLIDYNQGVGRGWLPFYALTSLGHSAVIVFFVLSGFWISRSVLRRIDRRDFWPVYLIDRIARLGIVLVPALLLGGLLDVEGAIVLHLPAYYQGVVGNDSMTQGVVANLTLPTLLGNLAFLQTIAVNPWGSNGPLWSLAWEFWFYIWFPALALSIHRRRFSPVLLALLIGLANPSIYWGFASWLVGLVLLNRYEALPADPARITRPRAAILWGTCFVVVLLGTGAIRQSWTDVPLAISFAVFLLALARSQLRFPRVLAPLAHFGRQSSFSLYAIHFPIMALIGGWIVGPQRLAPGPRSLLLVLLLTGFCGLAGWLFSRLTERYTPRLRDGLKRLLPAAAPAQSEM